jgi:hypothetical protein
LPIILCEDPSVAMSLSIGLKSSSSSYAAAARRMRMNAMTKDKNDDDDDDKNGDGGGSVHGGHGATDCYYTDNNEVRATSMKRTTTSAKSAKVAGHIAAELGYAGGDASTSASKKPVAYGPF